MATSQKDANRFPLMVMLTINAAVFWGLVTTQQVNPAAWSGSFQGDLIESLPIALALVLTGVLNSQITPLTKAKLISLDWLHLLLSHRALSEYLRRNNLTDAAQLER